MIKFFKLPEGYLEHDILGDRFIQYTPNGVTILNTFNVSDLVEIPWTDVDKDLIDNFDDGYQYLSDTEWYHRVSVTDCEVFTLGDETYTFYIDTIAPPGDKCTPIPKSEWLDKVWKCYDFMNHLDDVKITRMGLAEIGYRNGVIGISRYGELTDSIDVKVIQSGTLIKDSEESLIKYNFENIISKL